MPSIARRSAAARRLLLAALATALCAIVASTAMAPPAAAAAPPAAAPAAPPAAASVVPARPVPEAGPVSVVRSEDSYSLARLVMTDGRSTFLRWNPCQQITYGINVSAVPAARRDAVRDQIRAAVRRLADATGLRYRYVPETPAVPRTENISAQKAELVIAVTSPEKTDFKIGSGMLGYGGYRYWEWSAGVGERGTSSAAIARAWVVVDGDSLMRLRPGFGPGRTQGNVFLHELAHTVGVDHVNDPRQLANPDLLPSAPDGYAPGDRTALRRLGRTAGCIEVPDSVVSDLA